MVIRSVVTAWALVLALAGCAAEANSSASIDTSEPVVSAAFVEAATTAIGEAAPVRDGWVRGVVIGWDDEDLRWVISLVTADGGTTITEARDCERGDFDKRDHLLVLLDPGDLIEWSTEGDDDRVCSYEVRLVQKAAAL